MRSKAHYRTHPIHPMLIPFPIASIFGAVVADMVGVFGAQPWPGRWVGS